MLVTGLTLDQFRGIVEALSRTRYDGNVIVHPDAYQMSKSRFRARLRTTTGRGAGARRTWRGRHMPTACWHAYRDVLAELFRQFPNARVQSGNSFSVVYRGAADFAVKYPQTGRENIGSQMQPITMPELCDCEHEEEYTVIEPDPAVLALINRMDFGYAQSQNEQENADEPGGQTYAGRLETQVHEYADGTPQGTPNAAALLDEISSLIDGDPWMPSHP